MIGENLVRVHCLWLTLSLRVLFCIAPLWNWFSCIQCKFEHLCIDVYSVWALGSAVRNVYNMGSSAIKSQANFSLRMWNVRWDDVDCCGCPSCRACQTQATITSSVDYWRGSSQTISSVNWSRSTTTQTSSNSSPSSPSPAYRCEFTCHSHQPTGENSVSVTSLQVN